MLKKHESYIYLMSITYQISRETNPKYWRTHVVYQSHGPVLEVLKPMNNLTYEELR